MAIEHPYELAPYIEHALLRVETTATEVEKLCEEAITYGFHAVCVNPVHVSIAAWLLKNQKPVPVSVIGFPLGATFPAVKAAEAREAIMHGAQGLDMVLNLAAFLANDTRTVLKDIRGVVDASRGAPVKVIIETGLLNDEQICRACELCVEAGAAYIKTCTGNGTGYATPSVVRLMKQTVGDDIGIMASGGIRNFRDAYTMIEAGASRIGSSTSTKIVKNGSIYYCIASNQ